MNTVNMYLMLGRARKGLNLIIVGNYTIKAFGVSALASGILIIITRWLGWPGASILTWLLFTCGGGLLGLAIGLGWKRWDEAAVARWIDTKFEFQDAITAALICLERGCSGLLDQGIIERAQLVSADRPQIKWPLAGFYRQSIHTVLLIGVTVLALIYVPARLQFHFQTPGILSTVNEQSGRQPENRQEQMNRTPLTPRDIAKILFPQDPKLMAQAEKAVMAGDLDLLQELLRQAMIKSGQESLDQTSAASQQELVSEAQKQLMQSLISANSMEDVQQMMEEKEEQQSQQDQAENQKREQNAKKMAQRQPSNGSKQGDQQMQQYQKYLENQNMEPNQSPSNGQSPYNSSQPGQGAGTKGGYTKITPQSDANKKPIILANKGGFFEYLLPGKDTKTPLAGVLPGAAQASEQALYQQQAPGEYADYTRSYFLKLSQFITGSSPESGGKP